LHLQPKYGPIHIKLENLTYETVSKAVNSLILKLRLDEGDCSEYYVSRIKLIKQLPSNSPKCTYQFQRGVNVNSQCGKLCENNPKIIGSNEYCRTCLKKTIVRKMLDLPMDSIDESNIQDYNIKPYYDNDEVTRDLLDNGYHVINAFEKYYVIANAIDYAQFTIYSKDCTPELINWTE